MVWRVESHSPGIQIHDLAVKRFLTLPAEPPKRPATKPGIRWFVAVLLETSGVYASTGQPMAVLVVNVDIGLAAAFVSPVHPLRQWLEPLDIHPPHATYLVTCQMRSNTHKYMCRCFKPG